MVVELRFGLRTVDLPYTVYVPGVTEKMFDELVDEDTKAELLDGEMIVHSPASPRHNRIAGFLRDLGGRYAEKKGLGDIFGPDDLVHLATCRRFAPDGFFLRAEHVPHPLPDEQFEVVPDLVMEVLSPSTRDYDLLEKRPAYQQAGVREIWFVDPDEECVLVDYRRKRIYAATRVDTGRVSSSVLQGFWFDCAWLWAQPLPSVARCLRRILR
jgi:Uma2 family endonuclease